MFNIISKRRKVLLFDVTVSKSKGFCSEKRALRTLRVDSANYNSLYLFKRKTFCAYASVFHAFDCLFKHDPPSPAALSPLCQSF